MPLSWTETKHRQVRSAVAWHQTTDRQARSSRQGAGASEWRTIGNCERAEPRRVRRRTADVRRARSSLLSSVLLSSSQHPTSPALCRRAGIETTRLIQAFVTSRLDYCNALFADCSDAVRQRLQRIQNSGARVIHSQPVFTRATPLFHWLPLQKLVTYKLCVLMFDIVRGSAPSYLTDLCNICSDDRLRSASRGLFAHPRTNTRLANNIFCNRPFSLELTPFTY